MLHIQEKILIHRAQRGDQNAFAKLYNEYITPIRRLVIFKISDPDKAEEVISTVFIKTFNYLIKGEEIENFRALLYQIARYTIIDFYRTKNFTVSLEEVADKISSSPNYHELIDQKKEIEDIKKYMTTLEDHVREIITLRFFEGLSYKEIAKLVGQKEPAVRMIVHRGLKVLKERIKNEK